MKSPTLAAILALTAAIAAQEPPIPSPPDGRPQFFPGPGNPGGPGPGRFGGPGPMHEEVKLVARFDTDADGWLNATERQAARESLAKNHVEGRGQRRPGPPGMGRRESQTPAEPGPRVSPADVPTYPKARLYDREILRTFFLDFENPDWEKELADFHGTDVEVPARLTVDGRTYPDVGVHFRGASSYFMVPKGRKRSLNLSLDFVHEDQRLSGYRTLNLLNSSGDPTMLRAVLYHHIARRYLPSPRAAFVHLVINGESWGIYPSVQQFNKDFIAEWWGTTKGTRWKAPGSPNGQAGLEDLGDDPEPYKKRFTLKSKEDPKAWADLIHLCQVLNRTPAADLPAALAPILDVEGVLRFLALENVFINTDGYWTRASDYCLYQDESGIFHIVPHDVNETFQAAHGPGMDRRGGNGLELDPLVALNDPKKPLLSKLLAVPAHRARYLALVHEIAEKWLDWEKLGHLAQDYHTLIAERVKADTRKLSTTEAFLAGLTGAPLAEPEPVAAAEPNAGPRRFFGPPPAISLQQFAAARRAYLLAHPAVKAAVAEAR